MEAPQREKRSSSRKVAPSEGGEAAEMRISAAEMLRESSSVIRDLRVKLADAQKQLTEEKQRVAGVTMNMAAAATNPLTARTHARDDRSMIQDIIKSEVSAQMQSLSGLLKQAEKHPIKAEDMTKAADPAIHKSVLAGDLVSLRVDIPSIKGFLFGDMAQRVVGVESLGSTELRLFDDCVFRIIPKLNYRFGNCLVMMVTLY